jgi:hypothetical protein
MRRAMRYGPSSPRQRPHDGGGPSHNPATSSVRATAKRYGYEAGPDAFSTEVSKPRHLQAQRHRVVADLDRVSDVARQMRQAGLVPLAVALLGGVAVRDSHGRRVPVHHRVQVGDALGQAEQ